MPRLIILLAVASCLAATPAVANGEAIPISSIKPTTDEVLPQGPPSLTPFEVVTATKGMTPLFVEISTSPMLGQDGTLANDFVVDNISLGESDAFPGTYRGSSVFSRFLATTGKYYWQGSSYSRPFCAPPASCRYDLQITPVFTFTVQAPPAPPADTPPPSAAITLKETRMAIREGVRLDTGRPSRPVDISRCVIRTADQAACRTAWSTRKFLYAGFMNVRKLTDGFSYEFLGTRASIRCVGRYRTIARGVRRCRTNFSF